MNDFIGILYEESQIISITKQPALVTYAVQTHTHT